MEFLLSEYSDKFINNSIINTKNGFCKRCLNEGWNTACQKKTLYKYEMINKNEHVYVCYEHVGCLEVAKELIAKKKPINDLERMKSKKDLSNLIREGEKLLER